MKSRTKVWIAVHHVLIASALAATVVPAYAQEASTRKPDAAGAQAGQLDEIVITGSRISSRGADSSSSILVIAAADIERQQVADAEELLRNLPSAIPGDNPGVNNGSAGVSTINFRGLGPNRNLVLMDGKRMVPYNVFGFVDVSQLPVAMIDRVDILTGGASAVYGSDAMSGVVNFIMKRNFEGVALDLEGTQTDHGDAGINTGNATFGANLADGRGNVVLNLSASKRDAVRFDARSFGADNINSQTGASSAAEGGSFTTVPTLLFGNLSGYQADANGNLVDVFDAEGNPTPLFQSFNYNPYNYFQTPQEKWSALATGRFVVGDHAEAYSRFVFANSEVKTQLAPSGTFGFSWNVPIANPFLTAQARNTICRDAGLPFNATPTGPAPAGCIDQVVPLSFYRRTVEIGPRISDYSNNTYQFLLGLRGSIAGDWGYDVSYQRGVARRQIQYLNDINGNSIQQALLATSPDTCSDASNGCVPINLFGGLGSITPEMAAFVRLNLLSDETYTQEVTSGSVDGNLGSFHSPWSESPVAVALGLEYRSETGTVDPDSNLANANIPVGFGQTVPVSGSYDVKEAFAEVLAPIVQDMPFARKLDLQLGYRYSDYNLAGATDTYRIGALWAPIEAVRIRAQYQRAVRGANIQELFSPVAFGTGNLAVDPCAGAAPTTDPALAALCIATGAPAARVNAGTIPQPISGQVNNFTGGNLELTPETGDTYTFGVAVDLGAGWGAIERPTLSIDYYSIKIRDAINNPALGDVVNGCYSAALNPTRSFNSLCALIARSSINGSLSGGPTIGVKTVFANLASQEVDGIELTTSFDTDLGARGALNVSLIGNYYLKNSFQNSRVSPVNECAGRYGQNCGATTGGAVSKTRFTQRTTWSNGSWEVGYMWRYLSGVHVETSTPVLPQFASIKAYSYFDITAAYTLNDKTTVRLGIENVLDKNPPFVGGSAADTASNGGNTFPGVYDALGRSLTLGVHIGF